jgi:hypothetical protein
MCYCGRSGSFTPLLFTGNMFLCEQWFIYGAAIYRKYGLCGNCGSFTELLFTGNMCWCGIIGLNTEMLFTVKLCWCVINASLTELLLSQEIYVGVGELVHLRSCYFLSKYVLAWG